MATNIFTPERPQPTFEDISQARLERAVKIMNRLLNTSGVKEDLDRRDEGRVLGATPVTPPQTRMAQDAREHVTLGIASSVFEADSLVLSGPTVLNYIDRKTEVARTGSPVRSPSGLTVFGKTDLHEKVQQIADGVGEGLDDQIREVATRALVYLNTGMAALNQAYDGKESIMYTRGRLTKRERVELNTNRETALQRIEASGNATDAAAMRYMYGITNVLSRIAGPDGYWQDEGWMTAGHRITQLYLATQLTDTVLVAKGITDPSILERKLQEIAGEERGVTQPRAAQRTESLVKIYQPGDLPRETARGSFAMAADALLRQR